MKSKDSLAPSCVLVVFPVRPKCPDGVAPQAHVNGRKRVCCASIRHDSMLRGEFRAMQAASFGTRPRHDRLRVSGASSEHSAMQKARPLFTAKHAHTHSRKSRLRWAVVAPLLGRDSPVGPHPRNASSKRNRRKAGSACAGEMGACVYGACNQVRQHTGRLVFCCQKKSSTKKIRACSALAGGCPQTPLEPQYHYCGWGGG